LLTQASVSPNRCLRSEWPTITYAQPSAFSIPAEISPVNAPCASQCTFWAPSTMPLASSARDTSSSAVNGGATITSARPAVYPSRSCWISSTASGPVRCIFQFPATSGLRRGEVIDALRTPQDSSAFTPGSSLPSRNSSDAPPPVDT